MRFLSSLCLLSLFSVAQAQNFSSTVIEGRVLNDVSSMIPAASQEANAKYVFPAPNRTIFIFEGIHKDIGVDRVPYFIAKTDKNGKFNIRLKPGVYTFTILINSKYTSGNIRPDGYHQFIDCCFTKENKVELLDKSKAQ